MNVNPLMTLWLISCVISHSGLTGANRDSNLRSEKVKHEASELSRLYHEGDALASFKLDFLKLLTVEKKKKNKNCDTTEIREFNSCATSSSSSTAKNKKGSKTRKQAAVYNDESCLGFSTAKINKSTKKTKTQSIKNSQGNNVKDSKNINVNDINTGGSNKWKKIQKFFFFPPNWSLTRSYKTYETTTAAARYKEPRPTWLTQQPKGAIHDQTKITDSTYLYPIPVMTSNNRYKDNLPLKEEIMQKNATGEGNNNSKGQISEVHITNNHSMQQPSVSEKIPPHRFYEGGMMSREPVIQEEGYNKITPMDKMDKGEPSLQFSQQEAMFSTPWYIKSEKITSRQELPEPDKMPFTEGGEPPSQNLRNELSDTRVNHNTNRVIYSNENIVSNNQVESTNNMNYNNKATLTDIYQTSTAINEINNALNERQLQLKPEEIAGNTKDNYEVSMVREVPKLSFKPEATVELEQPPNQTSMENPESPYEQNKENISDKGKQIFSSIQPISGQFKNVYSNIINNERDLYTSRVANTLEEIVKPNFNNGNNKPYESNVTDYSNSFLEAFSKFLQKDYHNPKKLHSTTQQPLEDLYKFTDTLSKQYTFSNMETKLSTEQTKTKSNNVYANEEKFLTFNFDATTAFENPTTDYLQKMGTKGLLKGGSLFQKNAPSTSSTPSTIIQQYSIEMWPKYTEKTEYNVDLVSSQSSLHSSTPTQESAYLNQHEFNRTVVGDISSTEATDQIYKSLESTELPKAMAFEALLTIPLIFTDKESEILSDFPTTPVTTNKHLRHKSILNLTLHPMIFDNLWGIRSYLDSSSNNPISTKLDEFDDDKISFDNQHEFNADHHFYSTSQLLFSDPDSFKWAPFNIPDFRNEFGTIITSTFRIPEITQEYAKQSNDFVDAYEPLTDILKKNKLSLIEKNKMRKFPSLPKYMAFPSDTNARNALLSNHPLEKHEPEQKIHKYVNHKNELVNDPIWNEIIYQSRLGKEKTEPPLKDLPQSEDLQDRNKSYQRFRKPSLLEEKLRDENLKNNLPLPKGRAINNGRDDIDEFLNEAVLRNIKKMELMATTMGGRKFGNVEDIKNEIDEVVTKLINKDSKMRNNFNFWSNLNDSSSPETKELKEITNRYEQTNAEVNNEFIENLNNWPLLESQRKNFSKGNGNSLDLQSIINNEMPTKQAYATSLNDNKIVTTTNRWIHNEQNEKLLASEKSFDRQLSLPSPLPVSSRKQINYDHLQDNIGILKNMMNQFFPELTNNSDVTKNEISSIQMSKIKIFNKKPEMFAPQFKTMFDLTDNNTEISRMFLKLQDFANKFGMKKILLKRGIKYPQNYTFESNGAWRNKCSVVPFNNNFRRSMQSTIDKWNEKRNINLSNYNNNFQKYSERLLSNVAETNLKQLKKYLGNEMNRSLISYNYEKVFTDDNNKENQKKNLVGSKKMKSRELEFILDRNLPRLPLNKRLFISYMMTGLKNPGNSITLEDERHSQLSKANIQNLIDRNIKKDKLVELTSKRSRKKQWQTNDFR